MTVSVTFPQRPMTVSEWLLLAILSVLWGGSFLFVGMAVDDLPPLTLVLLLVGLAALALHVVLLVLGRRIPLTRAALAAFVGMGPRNNVVPFGLFA